MNYALGVMGVINEVPGERPDVPWKYCPACRYYIRLDPMQRGGQKHCPMCSTLLYPAPEMEAKSSDEHQQPNR